MHSIQLALAIGARHQPHIPPHPLRALPSLTANPLSAVGALMSHCHCHRGQRTDDGWSSEWTKVQQKQRKQSRDSRPWQMASQHQQADWTTDGSPANTTHSFICSSATSPFAFAFYSFILSLLLSRRASPDFRGRRLSPFNTCFTHPSIGQLGCCFSRRPSAATKFSTAHLSICSGGGQRSGGNIIPSIQFNLALIFNL